MATTTSHTASATSADSRKKRKRDDYDIDPSDNTRRDTDDLCASIDTSTQPHDRWNVLSAFLGPSLSRRDFLERFWTKETYHGGAKTKESVLLLKRILHDPVCGLESLDVRSLVESTPSPQIHVWVKRTSANASPLNSITVDADVAFTLHQAGASLYFRAPQDLEDALVTPLQRELGLHFGGVYPDGDRRSEVETFVSTRGHTTEWHTDFQENFTIQLSGVKRWTFAPGQNRTPVRAQTPHYQEPVDVVETQAKLHKDDRGAPLLRKNGWQREYRGGDPKLERVVVLRPGETLYFPSGMWHRVECLEDSISINISIKSQTWTDVVLSGVRQYLLAHPPCRERVRFDRIKDARDRCDVIAEKIRDLVSKTWFSKALISSQMCAPHDRSMEDLTPKTAGANSVRVDDDNESPTSVEIPQQRPCGGPSFGGCRVFELLKGHVDIPSRCSSVRYRRNPLAVLVDSDEVNDLASLYIRHPAEAHLLHRPVLALHINFGSDDNLSSLHRTLLVPPSQNTFLYVRAIGRKEGGTFVEADVLSAPALIGDINIQKKILSELCYCGLILSAGDERGGGNG